MTELRAAKIKGIEEDIAPLEVEGPDDARVLVLGWGGTYGQIGEACGRLNAGGHRVARAHLRHLNPLPKNTEGVLRRFNKIVVPELNMGQLSRLIQAEFLIEVISINQVKGLPFRAAELEERLKELI